MPKAKQKKRVWIINRVYIAAVDEREAWRVATKWQRIAAKAVTR